MAIVRELVTLLGFKIEDAEARRYDRRLADIGKKIRRVGRTLSLFVTAPIVALGGSFIKVAADAEETESKFKEVFRGITDEADRMAAALSKDFDLANTTAQEMLATTGSLLVQFGFTTDEALKMSKQVSALSVDIASFENVQGGAERASQAITKALLGEREMLKGINKVVLEEDVTRKIAILTAQGMTFETNRQAKAVATLALVTEQSERAIGDYSRTQGSATNQSRRLGQRWIDLSVTLGKVLLPIFTDAVKALSSFVEWINSFSPAGRKAIVVIAGIAAALGPLLLVLGSIVTILAAVPALAIAAAAAVAALGFLIGEDIAAFVQGRKSVVGLIFNAAKDVIVRIFDFLSEKMDAFVEQTAARLTTRLRAIAESLGFGGGGGAAGGGAGSLGIGEAVGSQLPIPGLGSLINRLLPERLQSVPGVGGNITVNAPITVNAAPGMSAGVLATQTAEEVTRVISEARSRAATSARTSK